MRCGKAGILPRDDSHPLGHTILFEYKRLCLDAARNRASDIERQECHLGGNRVHLCPISLFEIAQKVRIGKWPAMAAIAPDLAAYVYLQRIAIVPLDASICAVAGSMTWSHRDPFDRIIAATATHLGCPLISSDAIIDGIVARIR